MKKTALNMKWLISYRLNVDSKLIIDYLQQHGGSKGNVLHLTVPGCLLKWAWVTVYPEFLCMFSPYPCGFLLGSQGSTMQLLIWWVLKYMSVLMYVGMVTCDALVSHPDTRPLVCHAYTSLSVRGTRIQQLMSVFCLLEANWCIAGLFNKESYY